MADAGTISSLGGDNAQTLLARLSLAGKKIAGAQLSNEQIDKTAKDFESLFIAQMFESMFGESVGEDAFGSEDTNDIYKSLMMQEYGKTIANSGGIGIASYVKSALLKLQEV